MPFPSVPFLGLIRAVTGALSQTSRRVWANGDRVHVEVRVVPTGDLEEFAAQLEKALAQPGVEWSEFAPELGRVVVAADCRAIDGDELIRIVDGLERDFGVAEAPFARPPEGHPADVEPLVVEAVKMAGDCLGIGLGALGRVAFAGPGRVLGAAGTLLSVANGVPPIRRVIDRRIGSPAVEVVLGVGNAVAQGLAQAPLGPLADLVYHATSLAELDARRGAWNRLEPELFAAPGSWSGRERDHVLTPARPGPLPDGPVEQFTNQVWGASVAGAGVVAALSRDLARGVSVLGLSLPKAAVYGRGVFAAGLGRTLSGRGVLVLRPDVLRLLDRVDTLVVESALLVTDEFVIGEIMETGVAGSGEVRARLRALFDPGRAEARRVDGEWVLGPLGTIDAVLPERLRRPAGQLGQHGAPVLGLARAGELVALIQTRVALRPEAEDLVALTRSGGLELVIASGSDGVVVPVEADRTVPDGPAFADAVRDLQADGRVVAVVAAQDGAALVAADCGVGLRGSGAGPPWTSDIMCSDGLADVCFLVEACARAREVSRQSARLALAGASVGAFFTFRSIPGAGFGAGSAINTAALLSMANGSRAAIQLARQPRPLPRDPTPWHALETQAVLGRLGASESGLAAAAAAGRRARPDAPLPPALRFARDVVDEMFNPLTPVLAVGAGLSLVTGSAGDAGMVLAVVGLNAVIGGMQRFRADEAFAAIERTGRRRATVRRDGAEQSIDAEDVVVGDVVVLRAGDAVTADCRILSASGVEADESSLTGESFPVAKGVEPTFAVAVADRTSMLYDGTSLAAGDAVAVVVATGSATQARRAAAGRAVAPETGVEARLQRLTELTIPVAIGSGVATIAAGLLRRQPFGQLASGAVSLAVAAVPEGLPLLATVAELSASRRLAGYGVMVRNPRAVEALGRVEVMCVDKTGTVTEGRIRLAHVSDASTREPVSGLSGGRRAVLAAGLRATPAVVNGARLPHPTDWAVVRGAERASVATEEAESGSERVAEMPFEPARGFHATLWARAAGPVLSVKGAPEVVLPRCTSWRTDGHERPLDDGAAAVVEAELRRLTRQGLRVLAVAERGASSRADLDDDRIGQLVFLGFLAFADPVRLTAAQAVHDLRLAGIETVMITGDHPSTAEGVAVELDLLSPGQDGHSVLTGADLDGMEDDELAAHLGSVRVFARVAPAHKTRIVQAFQRAGRVVAMTGDGANDAPAIRLADVGIALGERSTSAARDAADLVVLDDRIETLVDAVAEGRSMWTSVRDAVALLVGGNLGEIAFTVGASLLGGQSPLSPRQLLLLNLLTDVAPAMAIAVQPPARRSFAELLEEGPERSLGGSLDRAILWRAACTGTAATGAWAAGRMTGTAARARTVGLVALVGSQLGQTVVAAPPRPATVAALAGSAGVLFVVVQTPGISHLFGCRPLGPSGWAIAGTAAAVSTVASVAVPRLASGLRRGPRAEGPELVPELVIDLRERAPVVSPIAPAERRPATGGRGLPEPPTRPAPRRPRSESTPSSP